MTKSALAETYDWLRKVKSGVQNKVSQTPLFKQPKQTLERAVYSALPAVGAVKTAIQKPVIQNAFQSAVPISGSRRIGEQLQKVNLPILQVSDAVQAGFPITQVPKQINSYAQSYGRTLSNPRKDPLESALNVAGFLPIGATFKNIRGITNFDDVSVNALRSHRFDLLEKAKRAPNETLRRQFTKAIANVEARIDDLYRKAGINNRGLYMSGGKIASAGKVSSSLPTEGTLNQSMNPKQLATQQQLLSQKGKTAIDSTNVNPQANPSIGNISQRSKEVQSYIQEMTNKQKTARDAGTKVGTVKRIYDEIKRKLVDSNAPIEDILNTAEKKGKFQVLPKDDFRLQVDKVLRSQSIATQFAKDNGLVDVIQKAPDLNALDQYMIAKHAKTIEATGRKTGRDLVKDQALLEELAPQYEGFAKQVTQYSQKLLDYTSETGLISKDLANQLKKQYPDYVPLNRIMDEVESFNRGGGIASQASQSIVKRLKGSELEIESPIASLLAKTDVAFKQGERNIAARQLASYKDLPGFEGLIKELKSGSTGKHTISYIENGVKKTYEVAPEIEAVAKSLNREQIGFLGKVVSVPTRVLRLGATGLNIPFVASNVVKDQLTALVNTNKAAKTSLINPMNFLKAVFSAAKHDDLYEELIRQGAGGTSFDIGRQAPLQTIQKIRSGRNIASKIGYTIKHPTELVTAIENLIGRSEEIARIQQFRGTREALRGTRTAQDASMLAAKAARENTANFARSGDWGKVINLILPYFNAGIQGARSTVRALQQRPVQTGTKIAIGLFTPVTAATMWNLSDPARKKVYEDIDDFEKENNIILVLDPSQPLEKGRYGGVLKIPLQQGFGALSSVVRRGIEASHGLDPVKAREIAANLIQFSTSMNVGSPNELASSLTPQALKVPLETMTNTNLYTGKQIVPQYMKSKPVDEQVFDHTSGTSRIIGKALNTSPLLVQNAIGTSFGGVGRQVTNASDTLLNKAGIIPESQIGGEDIATATEKRFGSASGGKKLDQAYKAKEQKDNFKREAINSYISGDIENTKRLMKEHGITIKNEDIKRATTTQKNKVADLYIDGKIEDAKALMKKYKLKITNADIKAYAKKKAIEYYKLGLIEETKALRDKYGLVITNADVR